METNIKLLNLVAVAALTLGIFACKKNVPPTVTIDNSVYATQTTVNVTGNVTDEGGTPVTDRGFIYGKQGNSKMDTVFCGSGGGEFPTRLTGLEPNTTYSCQAFATNMGGTSTSGKVSFTTLSMAVSDITTNEARNVSYTTATCGGYVNNDGGSDVTERGVCWGTALEPSTSNFHQSSGNGTGEFEVGLTGLTPNTTYHVRAYAVNSKGTAYGNEVTFKTLELSAPAVTTISATNITATTAQCGGEVTADGGAEVTARGVCYGTSQNPTISGNHTTNGTGTGSFTSNLTNLSPNKTYYVRAYATNSKGTSYGEQKSFKTPKQGALGGKFSINGSQQVYFSQGNLQYNASTHKYRFAESQLDYIGSANANISSTYSGWIDLFGWGTGNNPTNSSEGNSSYSSFTDWGTKPISNGGNQANQWRTLTRDEWDFLMFNRSTTSGIRYAKAAVNGVTGVIILPDDWSTSYYTLSSTNSPGAAFGANTITSANWTSKLEAHGAVFLPAAGYRDGTSVNNVGSYGYYWSPSPKGSDYAYNLYFSGSTLDVDYYYYYTYYHSDYYYRSDGHSVRLVSASE